MLHIIKNYRNLFLGLMESRLNRGDIQQVAGLDGDNSKLKQSDINKGMKSPHLQGKVREIFGKIKNNPDLLKDYQSKEGIDISKAVNEILGTIDNTSRETQKLKKDINSKRQYKRVKIEVPGKKSGDAPRVIYKTTVVGNNNGDLKILLGSLKGTKGAERRGILEDIRKARGNSKVNTSQNATIAAKHDTVSHNAITGRESNAASLDGVNKRDFENVISKLGYNQLRLLVQELANAAGTSITGISKVSVTQFGLWGNSHRIHKVFEKRGYTPNNSWSTLESVNLLNATTNILKTQDEVRSAPAIEKLKLLFDFNKDNYLTNHPEFYFGEAEALTNAVNNGSFTNPLTNRNVKFSNQNFGYLVNNIGLGSGGALLSQMNDNFYGARETFIDALGVSAAALQASSINPLVLFMKNGMERSFQTLGKVNTRLDVNNVNIRAAGQKIDQAAKAKGVNLSAQDRTRCISAVLSAGGVSFSKGRFDFSVINGKPSFGYTPYSDGRTAVRLGTFVPITISSGVKLSKNTTFRGSIFGGGAVPFGGSIGIERKMVAENSAEVQQRVNEICNALIAGKIPKNLTKGQSLAIRNLLKTAGKSRGTLQKLVTSGIMRGIQAGAFTDIKGKRVTSISASITMIATYLIPTASVGRENVSVTYNKINENRYRVNPKDIADRGNKVLVKKGTYEKAIYRNISTSETYTRTELKKSYNKLRTPIALIESSITHASMRQSVDQTVARNAVFNYKRGKGTIDSAWKEVSKVVKVKATSKYEKIVLMDAYFNATMKLNNTLDSSDPKKVAHANRAFQSDFGINSSLTNKWRKAYGDFNSKTQATSIKTDSRVTFAASTPTIRAGDTNAKAGRMPTGMVPYTGVVEIVNRREIDVTKELSAGQKLNIFKKFPKTALDGFRRYYSNPKTISYIQIAKDLSHNKIGSGIRVDYNVSFSKMGKCGNDALNVKNIEITTTRNMLVKKAIRTKGVWKTTKEIIPQGFTAAPVIGVSGLNIGFVGNAYDTSSDEGVVSSEPIEGEGEIENGDASTTPNQNGTNGNGGINEGVSNGGADTLSAETSGPPVIGNGPVADAGTNTVPAGTTGTPTPIITNKGVKITGSGAERAAQINALNDLATFCKANPNNPLCK